MCSSEINYFMCCQHNEEKGTTAAEKCRVKRGAHKAKSQKKKKITNEIRNNKGK